MEDNGFTSLLESNVAIENININCDNKSCDNCVCVSCDCDVDGDSNGDCGDSE